MVTLISWAKLDINFISHIYVSLFCDNHSAKVYLVVQAPDTNILGYVTLSIVFGLDTFLKVCTLSHSFENNGHSVHHR